MYRRLVERVSADEVTVDYANDLDTAQCGICSSMHAPHLLTHQIPAPTQHSDLQLSVALT